MRNAARVLPEPVGAEIRTSSPVRMAGQPWICGSVGSPKLLHEPFFDERVESGFHVFEEIEASLFRQQFDDEALLPTDTETKRSAHPVAAEGSG